MSAATQIYYASFDDVFLKLPPVVRARVESEIDGSGHTLIIVLAARIVSARASVIIESSTLSI